MKKRFFSAILTAALLITGCAGGTGTTGEQAKQAESQAEAVTDKAGASEDTPAETVAEAEAEVEAEAETSGNDAGAASAEKQESAAASSGRIRGQDASTAEPIESQNGNIVILYTNDVHCAVDTTIGYSGFYAYKKAMEEEGNAVFVVDDGDAIQGGTFGSITKGEAIIHLMNDVGYDLAIPGNHEFDYGVPRFLELTQMADFPYICCNFEDLRTGDLVFDSYVIREIGGKKIGFVGATTPKTIISSTPSYFKDENGEFIYGFMQSEDGTEFYQAVQDAVDVVNAQGVDYTILVAHLGIDEASHPYTSVDLIRNTTGIDAVLDGHSHSDVPMEEVKNKDGEEVDLTQSGAHLEAIGKLTIDASGEITSELITDWNQKDPGIIDDIAEERAVFQDQIADQIAYSDFPLAAKEDGVWLVRNNESNLGDLIADAYKNATGAEIGFANGGGIRADLDAGEITYEDVLTVTPFANEITCIKVKGQAVADFLEYTVSFAPDLFGGFPQVSGITFDVDLDKDPQTKRDTSGLFTGFESDERRVSNILVGGEPLDPEREYTVGGIKYQLIDQGDGNTLFDGAEVVDIGRYIEDVDAIAEYLSTFGGTVPEQYADRYGQERIHFISE